jgi:threonine dehydrogenase-like Zn-dependent dehydrogenase
MKAIVLTPGTTDVRIEDRPEPKIQYPDEVKIRILEVGICGTDREETSGGRAEAPSGQKELIIGHEMFGKVVEIGSSVKIVKPGDFAIFTVRRGCKECPACLMDSPDFCYTGKYTERGIKGLDGFQSEFVVDQEKYLIKVPSSIESFAVLCEPTSVVEKAIDEILTIQKSRLPDWANALNLSGKRALVAGMGPIGLLAAMVLLLKNAEVFGYDIVDSTSFRPQFLHKLGGTYIDGRTLAPSQIAEHFGRIDLIIEAAGVAKLDFNLVDALGPNGGFALTGVPGKNKTITVNGDELMQRIVLNNQVIVGSVNAGKKHWQMAVEDLERAGQRWGNLMEQLITKRFDATFFKNAFEHQGAEEIKNVITWNP